jgi:LacI family transcriptional regulator
MTAKRTDVTASAPGIRTIADALGISVATVHRALHNKGRISKATRARVLRMAEQVDYKPNLAARDLRLNRHFRFSVHFPTTIVEFFDSLRAGIEEGAAPFRPTVDLQFRSYVRGREHVQKSIRTALDAEVNGIIAVPPNTPQLVELVAEANKKSIPIIYVSTDAPESGRLTAVTAHPFFCGSMAAEVLATDIKKRSQLLVLAGDLGNLNQTEKIRGFRGMLAQAAPHLSVAAVFETNDEPREAYRAMRDSLRRQPKINGLYVSSANSIAALAALRELGRLEDMSIVTTDLFAELVPFIREGAVKATIYQCPEMQGKIAIQTMYRYLVEGIVPLPSIGIIPQLILRSNLDLYVPKSAIYQHS